MKSSSNKYFLLLFIFVLACSKEGLDFSSFTSAINSGGEFPEVEYSKIEEEQGETETQQNTDILTCTTTKISIKDALGGGNNFSLFSPNADVIFPGNLLQGKSLHKATPDEIPADRSGGEITISLLDGLDVSTVTVDKITLGSVTTAANQILAGKDADSVIPANFSFEKSIVQSEKEFALNIKADYSNAWSAVEGSLSFSSQSSYSRVMVTLEQTFYTMSFTTPFKIDNFFAPEADPEDLSRFIGPGNPPCYIKSVNYGRIFYMLIESSASETELLAAVNGSFSGVSSEGGGSVDTELLESIDEVNIKIFALGGDAATTIGATGLTKDNLDELDDILAKATDIRTGVPVSYKAQSVATNEIVAVQLATDYEKRNCTYTSALPPPVATEHWTGIKDLLGGPVSAIARLSAVQIGQNAELPYLFFDTLGVKCVLDYEGKLHGPYENFEEMKNENFPYWHTLPFENISTGAMIVTPNGNSATTAELIWINHKGNKYANSFPNYTTPDLIGNNILLDYFETEGIGAMCDFYPYGVLTVNKAGTRYQVSSYTGNGDGYNVTTFTGGEDSNKFLDGISAITRLDELVFATVDKSGKRYMVADFNIENGVTYFGPFKL